MDKQVALTLRREKLKRQLRISAALACLAVCVALIAFWWESYSYHGSIVGPFTKNSKIAVASSWGTLELSWETVLDRDPPPDEWMWKFERMDSDSLKSMRYSRRSWLGFALIIIQNRWDVVAPYWAYIVMTTAIAILLKPPPRHRVSIRDLLVVTFVVAAMLATLKFWIA